ncbi:hypothetical protein FAI40_08535 [Acetobacteraceae bacterium]|nr:hypothetical protein FAI40_08535 [Acetobacteraceae bacterium]
MSPHSLDALFKPLTAQEKSYAGQLYKPEHENKQKDWKPWERPPENAYRLAEEGDAEFFPHPMPRAWDGYKFHSFYCYTDEQGDPLYFVVRMIREDGGKVTPPLSYGTFKGRDGWFYKSPKKRVLFRLFELESPFSTDTPVLVCEGEKDALSAQKLFGGRYECTTSGGATSAKLVDWKALKFRNVLIWPDNDEAGKKYAQEVTAKAWEAGALSVSILPTGKIFQT